MQAGNEAWDQPLDIHVTEVPTEIRHTGQSRCEQRQEDPAAVKAIAFKRENERRQVYRQREYPNQGNRRDVLADMCGDRNQQRGSAGRQAHP
jgi:hypothetical protein